MIKLEIETAIAIYTFITVVSVLVLWVFFGYKEKTKKYTSSKKNIWQCSICLHTYVDSLHEAISKCPKCGSYNKRKEGDKTNDN